MWINIPFEKISKVQHALLNSGIFDVAKTFCDRIAEDADTECDFAKYRHMAKNYVHKQGELEVNDDAVVSLSKDDNTGKIEGAYVMCWKWIDNPDQET